MSLSQSKTIELRLHVHSILLVILITQCEVDRDEASKIAFMHVKGVSVKKLQQIKDDVDNGIFDLCFCAADVDDNI